MKQASYRKLISGESGGSAILRSLLGVASRIYSVIVRFRNFLYSKGLIRTTNVNAAVISVGNITAGGTGKTPLVVWLYKRLISNYKFKVSDFEVAILTRGYKAGKDLRGKRQDHSDEPAILAKSCPGAKVIVNPDRVGSAAKAINEHGAKVLIMDDAFQHRRLGRDLDIVTIDATCPFGFGRMLPAGLLREPVESLERAEAVVITRCDQVGTDKVVKLEEKLEAINSDMVIARAKHKPTCVKSFGKEEISIEQLRGKKVFAFCGLGNPNAFLKTVKDIGANLVGYRIYDDHYHYTDDDVIDIYKEAESLNAEIILSTQKDWYKTSLQALAKKDLIQKKKEGGDDFKEIEFGYLAIEMDFTAGEDKLKELIEETLASKIVQS